MPFTDRLSNELIEKANQEAHAILRSLSLVPDTANHNLPEVFDEKCYDEEIYISISGSAYDQSIWSVASVGDMNGDGFADILIGAPVTKSCTGAAYVVYSQQSSPSFKVEADSSVQSEKTIFKINSDTSQEKSVSSFTSDGINYLIVSKNGPWTDVNSEE